MDNMKHDEEEISSKFGFNDNKPLEEKTALEKWLDETCVDLSEKDFYPPEDKRLFVSGVRDTKVSTFKEFAEEYNAYEDELEIYN